MLIAGLLSDDPGWCIASAGFAIAAQVSRIADAWKERRDGSTE